MNFTLPDLVRRILLSRPLLGLFFGMRCSRLQVNHEHEAGRQVAPGDRSAKSMRISSLGTMSMSGGPGSGSEALLDSLRLVRAGSAVDQEDLINRGPMESLLITVPYVIYLLTRADLLD